MFVYSPHTSNKYMSVGKYKKNEEMKNIYLFFLAKFGWVWRSEKKCFWFYFTLHFCVKEKINWWVGSAQTILFIYFAFGDTWNAPPFVAF